MTTLSLNKINLDSLTSSIAISKGYEDQYSINKKNPPFSKHLFDQKFFFDYIANFIMKT